MRIQTISATLAGMAMAPGLLLGQQDLRVGGGITVPAVPAVGVPGFEVTHIVQAMLSYGLFEQVEIGERVRIVNQPFLFGWQNGDLRLEAHAPLVEDERDWLGSLTVRARSSMVEYPGDSAVIDERRIDVIAGAQLGFPVSVLAGGADIQEQVRDARHVRNIVARDRLVSRTID